MKEFNLERALKGDKLITFKKNQVRDFKKSQFKIENIKIYQANVFLDKYNDYKTLFFDENGQYIDELGWWLSNYNLNLFMLEDE